LNYYASPCTGIDRQVANYLADYLEKGDKKEYQVMFEAVIESIIEERDAARKQGLEQSQESFAWKALAEGIPIEKIHAITGLDIEAVIKLAR